MNNILSFLGSHGSARSFTEQPISEADELTIIQTAVRSPTSSNLHAYSILSVRNKKGKDKLAELCGGQKHVASCSLFLVFCADMHRLGTLCKEKGYRFNGETTESFIVATVDASLAACRALMAAQAMGMGGVMVGGIRNHPEEVCEMFALPNLVYPVMGMSLGYPTNPPKVKPRLPLGGLYFNEKYDESRISSAIEEYDRIISKCGYLRGREIETDSYSEFNGEYSWSEHTARRMASKIADTARPHMLPFLQKRGFLVR